MTRIAFCASALAALLSAALPLFAAEYDLDSYLKKVEQNNPDILLAQKEIDAARQVVIQARSAFLPRLGAQGDYKRNVLERTQSTPVASLPGGGSLVYKDVKVNYDNELTLGIGVTQTLFDMSAITGFQQARSAQGIREQSFEAVKQNLRSAAKKLYAQARLAATVTAIMESSMKTSEEIYQSIERKYRAGTATELDLLMAEVDWKRKIPAVSEAGKNLKVIFTALHNLAGIPLSEDIILGEDNFSVTDPPEFPSLDHILASRPDYRALVLSRELADINRRAALGSFLPVISGGFSFAYVGMGNGGSVTGDYNLTTSQLTLGVNIPLFAGGYRVARVKAAQIEQDKASLSLLKKRGDIESALIEIELRINETKDRIETARLVTAAAERALTLAKSAYTNGLITQLAVTEASNKLDEASLSLQNAIFEYRCAFYDLELVIGV